MSTAARDLLAVLHEAAAEQNDKLHLFADAERFPEVFRQAAAVTDTKDQLSGLLPVLRKQLRLPRLEYVSLVNQGDYLVEVPSDRRDIPKVTELP